MISNILGANHIPLSAICFIDDPTNNIQYITPILYTLKDWNLEFDTPNKKSDLLEGKEYVVFHTKLRMIKGSDYVLIKERLKKLYNLYKTNYTIVLLGEREIVPYKGEEIHNIQTIYDELKELENNNTVIDLTVPNIYKELNYESYINDMVIVKNAKCNMIIGCGGHYVSSLVFSKGPVITYFDEILSKEYRESMNIKKNTFKHILRASIHVDYLDLYFAILDIENV